MTGAVVVVGGGPAGVSLCVELRNRGWRGALTVVDRGDLLHDRPPLSKGYLAGEQDETAIALQPDSWFARHEVTVRTGVSVTGLVGGSHVELGDGEHLPADVVVLATGGLARPLPVPGAERVHTLRTVEDARRLRPLLTPGTRLAVVGGGLIGAEVASTAGRLGCTVTLTDPLLPLEQVLGAPLAGWLHGQHEEHGITTLSAGVREVTAAADGLTLHLADGSTLDVDVAVAGVGMLPDTALAAACGARVDGGVVVDERRRTSLPGVYAIGDCARLEVDGRLEPLVEHWEGATHDAAVAAAAILGEPAPPPAHGWWWTDRHGHHVEAIGDVLGGTEVVRGEFGVPPFTVFHVDGTRLLGLVAVDSSQSVAAARRILAKGIPVDAAALADPAADLRTLLRAWMRNT